MINQRSGVVASVVNKKLSGVEFGNISIFFNCPNLDFFDEFWKFYDLLSTLRGCNFLSTEPILNISVIFSRRESNSFIFAVLVARSKVRVPSHDYLWD